MTSPVDYLVAAAGAFWILKGLFRGFAGEVLSLLGWVLGVFAGLRFGGGAASSLQKSLGLEPPLAAALGFLGVLLGCLLAAALLSRVVRSALSAVRLSLLDRLLGGVLGAAKVLLLLFGIYFLGTLVSPWLAPHWTDGSVALRFAQSHWEEVQSLGGRLGLSPTGTRAPHPLPPFLQEAPQHPEGNP